MTIEEIVRAMREAYPVGDPLLFDAVGLAAESGELLNVVKKFLWYGNQPDPTERIIDELSDVYFHVISMCLRLGITQDDLAAYAVNKQKERLPHASD